MIGTTFASSRGSFSVFTVSQMECNPFFDMRWYRLRRRLQPPGRGGDAAAWLGLTPRLVLRRQGSAWAGEALTRRALELLNSLRSWL